MNLLLEFFDLGSKLNDEHVPLLDDRLLFNDDDLETCDLSFELLGLSLESVLQTSNLSESISQLLFESVDLLVELDNFIVALLDDGVFLLSKLLKALLIVFFQVVDLLLERLFH